MTADQKTCPWLEYFPEGGDRVETIRLEKDAFTIGRCDSADFQIDSTRVSREHARIIRTDGDYQIRDLGSTNGTYVNGECIDEAELSAGDVIVVADTEFVFATDSASRLRRMATQQMSTSPPGSRGGSAMLGSRAAHDAVLALRIAHERLCCGFIPVELTSIVELPSASPFAHLERLDKSPGFSSIQPSPLLQPPSHALVRLLEAQRLETVNRCAALPECSRIIVPLEAWEISELDTLIWHFEAMASILPPGVLLFASVKASDAVDLVEVQQFCGKLLRMGLAAICCRDFVGSHAHVEHLAELRPQLLLLSSELTEGVADQPQRHSRLGSVVEACHGLEIRPVVAGRYDQESIELLLDLGVELFESDSAAPYSHPSNSSLPREVLSAAT